MICVYQLYADSAIYIKCTMTSWSITHERVVADIAPWFCLRLPSCGPGFESLTHHLHFFNLYVWNCYEKRTKINKRGRDWPIFKIRESCVILTPPHHYCVANSWMSNVQDTTGGINPLKSASTGRKKAACWPANLHRDSSSYSYLHRQSCL